MTTLTEQFEKEFDSVFAPKLFDDNQQKKAMTTYIDPNSWSSRVKSLCLKYIQEAERNARIDEAEKCNEHCEKARQEERERIKELEQTIGILEMEGRKTIKIEDVRYYLINQSKDL